MDSINWSRSYEQTGEISAYRPIRRPDRSLPLMVEGGRICIGGTRTPLRAATFVEGASICKVDADIIKTIKRIIANGYNTMFLRAFNGRQWNESSINWGMWAYEHDDPDADHRWMLEPTALEQFDKTIAWALDMGIEAIYLDFTGYDENIIRHPSQRPYGTYFSLGMQWSDEARQMMWDGNSRIFDRESTVSGFGRIVDCPRIMYKFFNENGFSDYFRRSSTYTWSGGPAGLKAFDKIVGDIDDTTPTYTGCPVNNGYWLTELNAKLAAYATSVGWTVPNWDPFGGNGMPTRDTWYTWGVAADKNHLIDFMIAMDIEANVDMIRRMRALNPNAILNPGTFNYQALQAMFGLPEDCQANLIGETHHYIADDTGVGAKSGSGVTRRSIMDPTWGDTISGSGWFANATAVRSAETAFMESECGQYTPNRWRYQVPYYQLLMACMHGYEWSDFMQSQQITASQYNNDGRYMAGDNANIGSPAYLLGVRAMAPVHQFQLIEENASSFTIQTTDAAIKTFCYSNVVVGVQGGARLLNAGSDGTEHAVWSGVSTYIDVDMTDTATPTSDTTAIKVSDAAMAAGKYVRNTATEVIYAKHGAGVQLFNEYLCGFFDTLREKAAADAIAVMPMYLSNMSAAVECAVCFLRSDGRWPLFTGPMKLYIHGSDYDTTLVTQGGGPGEASFMSTDRLTVYYSSGQTWLAGNTAADVRLMMPEPFTVNLITPVDLEIFGVGTNGIPVRLSSTYAAGIWSFNYTGVYPEYIVQPKVTSNVLSHLEIE